MGDPNDPLTPMIPRALEAIETVAFSWPTMQDGRPDPALVAKQDLTPVPGAGAHSGAFATTLAKQGAPGNRHSLPQSPTTLRPALSSLLCIHSVLACTCSSSGCFPQIACTA